MGVTYHCPYCGWQGIEPSVAEYPDTLEGTAQYEADIKVFRDEQDNHDCKKLSRQNLKERR